MQSFVILVAEGYSSEAKSAIELYDLVTSKAVEVFPPFEVEIIVANGPRLAGDVLIFYLDDSFTSCPSDMGSSRFYSTFLEWLRRIIIDIESLNYIIELYGPRNYDLGGYWSGINIVKKKRLTPK